MNDILSKWWRVVLFAWMPECTQRRDPWRIFIS